MNIDIDLAKRTWGILPQPTPISDFTSAMIASILWAEGFEKELITLNEVDRVSRSFIVTVPSGANGNALVALSQNGIILWSWHIWVTGYDVSGVTKNNT